MLDAYLRKKREQIFLVFSCKKVRIFVGTGEYCHDKWWEHDFVSEKHPQYTVIAEKLNHYLTIASVIISDYLGNEEEIDGDKLKEKFKMLLIKNPLKQKDGLNIRLDFTLLQDFDKFIENRVKFYKKNTIRNYRYTRNVLSEFESHYDIKLDVDIFNSRVFEQFVSFMILEKNMMNNTIDKHVNVLKAFYSDAYPQSDKSFIKYNSYVPEIIALTEEELMKVIGIPANNALEKVKDLFVFLATTGMRISDCMNFNPHWITDGLIVYSAAKTMSKAYVPLLDIAKVILEKYNGKPPKMCEQYFNRELKKLMFDCGMDRPVVLRHRQGRNEIEEMKPLYEVVSSHTGRKTFISMMLSRGVPIQDVMNMSGHQDYRSMKPYIQVNQKHMKEYKNKLGL